MTADALFELLPLVTPNYRPEQSIAERFAEFHRENPHVADALEQLADRTLAGNPRVSTKALVEYLRWETGIATGGNRYKLDNSFSAFYSRELLRRRPEWEGRIELRTQRAAA